MSDQFWLDGKVLRKGKEYVGEFAAYEPLLLRELLTDKQAQKAQPPCGADGAVTFALDYYDAGLLGDGGGGNVEWWQDYMRSELSRAHDCYQSQIDANHQTLLRLFSLENGDDPIPYVKRLIAGTTTYHDAFNGRAPMPTPVAPATVAVPDEENVAEDAYHQCCELIEPFVAREGRTGGTLPASLVGAVETLVERHATQPQAAQAVPIDAVALAYGILWHANNMRPGYDAPAGHERLTPEKAAYKARHVLRDLLTRDQLGDGINRASDMLAASQREGGA